MRDWLALRRPTSNTFNLGEAFAGYVRRSISPEQVHAGGQLQAVCFTWCSCAVPASGWV
jgi:hypothetical protein